MLPTACANVDAHSRLALRLPIQDRILRERLPCALVFENDVLLAPGFVRRLGHLALPEALDVLKLETCNLAAPFRMTRLQVPLHYRYIAVTLPLHYRSG